MKEKNLTQNLEYAEKHKNELFKKYPFKHLIIYQQKVVNSFDTYEKAAEEAIRLYEEDADFLIYYVVKDEPINFILAADL